MAHDHRPDNDPLGFLSDPEVRRSTSPDRKSASGQPSVWSRILKWMIVIGVVSVPVVVILGYIFWYDNSPRRAVLRALTPKAGSHWNQMSEASKAEWEALAKKLALRGGSAQSALELFQEYTAPLADYRGGEQTVTHEITIALSLRL